MLKKTVASAVFALSLTLAGAGCGLIDSDIAAVRFDLPERTYSFSTAQTGVALPATPLPKLTCTTVADCCVPAMLAVPGVDCAMLVCLDHPDGDKACGLTTTIETPHPQQMVDLKREAGGLSKFSNQSVIDVTVSKITYDITMNTLNVDLPPIELFVAGEGAATTADPSAKKFGTVPATPAGSTPVGGEVILDPAGVNAFKALARNFGTPFVFMARTTVVIAAGTEIPRGGVELKVKGQLKANAF